MKSISDPDVWIIPWLKPGGFIYYEYVLWYVNDVLCISDDPLFNIKGKQVEFKTKGGNIEVPDMYLDTEFSNMTNIDVQ